MEPGLGAVAATVKTSGSATGAVVGGVPFAADVADVAVGFDSFESAASAE